MKTFKEKLFEEKRKIIKVVEYKTPMKKYKEPIYTVTDGSGNYILANDKSIFFTTKNSDHLTGDLDGKPKRTSKYDQKLGVWEVDGKLGVFYTDTLELKWGPYNKMSELVTDLEEEVEDDPEFMDNFEDFKLK